MRTRKYAQRHAQGCKICGDPEVGRGIQVHVEHGHGVAYDSYRKFFAGVITDDLVEIGQRKDGRRVMMHTLVRRLVVPGRT